MNVDTLIWTIGQVFVVVLGHIIGNSDRVKRPTLVHTGDLLSDGGQETLVIEETSHPEGLGAAFETAGTDLSITIFLLREPET